MKKFAVLLAALLLMTFGLNAYALTDNAKQKTLAVKNPEGDNVGMISNILADPIGNIAFVVLSLTKEKGGRDIVVPLGSFSKNEGEELVLNLSESELASAPEFDISSLDDPAYAQKIYRFYGMMPSWSEGTAEEGEQ